MSSNSSSSNNQSSSLPRLGPTWRSTSSGRGFQPPPAVPSSSNDHAADNPGNNNSHSNSRNSFSLLDMDDDNVNVPPTTNTPTTNSMTSPTKRGSLSNNSNNNHHSSSSGFMSRSEGLRSSGTGSGGFSSRSSKLKGSSVSSSSGGAGGGGGRSLADLASRFERGSSTSGERSSLGLGSKGEGGAGGSTSGGSARHHHHRDRDHHHHHHHSRLDRNSSNNDRNFHNFSANAERTDLIDDKSVVRYTRERLLSMRPRPTEDDQEQLPNTLTALDGTSLFSKEPLDPGTFCISYLFIHMDIFFGIWHSILQNKNDRMCFFCFWFPFLIFICDS